jgi:hypothetical protein
MRLRLHHIHYKPLYTAIGEPNNRHRKRRRGLAPWIG